MISQAVLERFFKLEHTLELSFSSSKFPWKSMNCSYSLHGTATWIKRVEKKPEGDVSMGFWSTLYAKITHFQTNFSKESRFCVLLHTSKMQVHFHDSLFLQMRESFYLCKLLSGTRRQLAAHKGSDTAREHVEPTPLQHNLMGRVKSIVKFCATTAVLGQCC